MEKILKEIAALVEQRKFVEAKELLQGAIEANLASIEKNADEIILQKEILVAVVSKTKELEAETKAFANIAKALGEAKKTIDEKALTPKPVVETTDKMLADFMASIKGEDKKKPSPTGAGKKGPAVKKPEPKKPEPAAKTAPPIEDDEDIIVLEEVKKGDQEEYLDDLLAYAMTGGSSDSKSEKPQTVPKGTFDDTKKPEDTRDALDKRVDKIADLFRSKKNKKGSDKK